MKLIHLSDLHLGKRVNEFPMLEDQRYILLEILGIIEKEKPDGVIAGACGYGWFPARQSLLWRRITFTCSGGSWHGKSKVS